MIRKYIVLSFCAILSLCCWGQNSQTAEINKIKKNRDYLCVTGTSMKSDEESSHNAQILLAAEIEAWLKENTKEDVTGYTAKAKQCIGFIQTRIGSLHRTFAYVRKTDILPHYKGDVIISDNSQTETDADKAITENSDSALIEKTASGEGDLSSTAVAAAAPDNDAEENTAVQKDKTSAENNIMRSVTTKGNTAESDSKGVRASQAEESEIIKLITTNAAKSYLSTLKNEKRILRYSSEPDYPRQGVVYILFFDYHGIVRRHVRCTDGVSVDLKTGSVIDLSVLIDQYSAKNSIWFTLK